jgi:GTPase SAR1 family protein
MARDHASPQERFRSLIPSNIRDSAAAIIVYDITSEPSRCWDLLPDSPDCLTALTASAIDRKSFENVQKWHDNVRADSEVSMQLRLSQGEGGLDCASRTPKDPGFF